MINKYKSLVLLTSLCLISVFLFIAGWFFSDNKTQIPPASLCAPWLQRHYPRSFSSEEVRSLLMKEEQVLQRDNSLPYFDLVVLVPTSSDSPRRRFVRQHVYARQPFHFARVKLLFITGGLEVEEATTSLEDDVFVAKHCRDHDRDPCVGHARPATQRRCAPGDL